MSNSTKNNFRFMLTLALLLCLSPVMAQSEPFKIGIEQRGYIQDPYQGQAEATYPAPQMSTMQGGIQQQALPALQGSAGKAEKIAAPKPIKGGATSVALPPGFMGSWLVRGTRVKMNSLDEYREQMPRIFAMNTQNIWTISGNAKSGYSLSADNGVKTSIAIDSVNGNTAVIKYGHPIGNTTAQESVVMQLQPGGASFNGLERIAIVKKGLAQPRAEVTYQLAGSRSR